MAVGGVQPELPSYPHKRQKLDNMAAPVFFKIDDTQIPFPCDDRSYLDGMGEAAFKSRLVSKAEPTFTATSRKGKGHTALKDIRTSKAVRSPLASPQLYPPRDEHPSRFSRQSSETPSTASLTSLSSSFSSDSTLIRIRQPPAILPRTEANGIENEVLTIRYLSRRQSSPPTSNPIPVLSVLRLLRDRNTHKLTAAILEKPTAVPLSNVTWPPSDRRHKLVATSIAHAKSLVSSIRPPAHSFGPVASVTAGTGRTSWREAFLAMFDALLMDAEDSWANLPFTRIRDAAKTKDAGTEAAQSQGGRRGSDPFLVIPGFGDARNVLVDEATGEVRAYVGFREAYWGDPEAVHPGTNDPLYRIWQAVRVVALASVRPEAGSGAGKAVIEARQRLMVALLELEGGSAA